jgi:hypothetical protein
LRDAPPELINTSFILVYLHILDFFTLSLSSPLPPLNRDGSQVLTHLCEHVFFFFKRCIYTTLLSASVFTTTGLLTRGLISGVGVPDA